MTFLAIHFHVLPDKREIGQVVIELRREPILGNMAPLAIGDPLLCEILSVDIVVAIETSAS